jgi:hypothetical protein
MSGSDSSSRQSARRRRSPPEIFVTSASGRRAAQRVHRDLELAVEVPRVARLDLVLHLGLFLEQLLHRVAVHRLGKLRGDVVEAREQRLGLGDALLDVLERGLLRVEARLLLEEADLDVLRRLRVAQVVLVDARHDPQQRRLARAVEAQDADLRAVEERQPDALEDDAVRRNDLAHVLHGVDEIGQARPPESALQGRGWGALRVGCCDLRIQHEKGLRRKITGAPD